MKKFVFLVLSLVCLICLFGCQIKDDVQAVNTIERELKTYRELSNGTWECEGQIYTYRLEIHGRMHNAVADSTFVYLSNLEDISFERAWKAAGFGDNLKDYFPKEDAVLVGWTQD